ncbi:hypothetical protein HMPREF0185_00128, partial [Brevundimonas diminuta 470-4]
RWMKTQRHVIGDPFNNLESGVATPPLKFTNITVSQANVMSERL